MNSSNPFKRTITHTEQNMQYYAYEKNVNNPGGKMIILCRGPSRVSLHIEAPYGDHRILPAPGLGQLTLAKGGIANYLIFIAVIFPQM